MNRIAAWRLLLACVCICCLSACTSLPRHVQRTPSYALPAADSASTPLAQVVQTLRATAAPRHANAFVLLDSADSAFAARLALAQQATRTLDLQYYAIHADTSSRALLRAVRNAAARGVRVRVLLDDFNTAGMDAQVLRLAFVPNVQMRLFNPLPGGRGLGALRAITTLHDFNRLQRRMHNKLFLADNVMGITGGRNLGDAYFGQNNSSNFIDLDVLTAGALVRRMSTSFDSYWNHPLAYPVEQLVNRKALDALREATSGTQQPPPAVLDIDDDHHDASATSAPPLPAALALETAPWVWAASALLTDRPAKLEGKGASQRQVVDGMVSFMQRARQRVLIVSPYFIPNKAMLETFAQLHQRGVEVVALTNSLASTDAPAAHIGYQRHRKKLLRSGVRLYEMRSTQARTIRGAFGSSGKAPRASLHAKFIVVDGTLLGVGSMNLDPRSHLHNSEVALILRSPALAQHIEAHVHPIVQHSAWQVELQPGGHLIWRAPQDSGLQDQTREPDASLPLKASIWLLAPFAPDSLL